MPDHAPRLVPIATLAALLVVVVGLPARPSRADMVLTADGKWWPLPEAAPGTTPVVPSATDEPNDDLLVASRDVRIDATYETVKSTTPTKAFSKPAAYVLKIRSSDSIENSHFREGANNATSGQFADAAEAFRAAAAELSGFGKQDALWSALRVTAATGDGEKTQAAIDELLAAFPKSFFFADAYIFRARIAAAKGDTAAAAAALDKIKNAPGMNFRDLYRGEQNRVFLTLEVAKKYDAAATEYRLLITRMAAEKDAALVASTKQQCLVGLGNCLLATKKETEARAQFEGATESHDADVLAGAYAGLGDVDMTDASALRTAGKLPEAKAKLEDALLHYLRVTTLYKPNTTDDAPVFHAYENQAKVFSILFDMGNGKEFDLIDRCRRSLSELMHMMPAGPQRNQIVKDYNAATKKWKDATEAAKPK